MNEDPPREFYQIIAEKYEEVGGSLNSQGGGDDADMGGFGEDDEDDWNVEDAYGEEEETKD